MSKVSFPKDKMRVQWTEWLVENVAPTILGSKPSTILTLANTPTLPLLTIWHSFGETMMEGMIVHHRTLTKSANRETVLFYRPDILTECIRKCGHSSFLKNLQYPVDEGLEACLDLLEQRFQDCCPHEVGILLGIPLKDVLGFMKLNNLPLTCRQHWCVYGNPDESIAIMNKHTDDYRYLSNLVVQGYPPMQILRGKLDNGVISLAMS